MGRRMTDAAQPWSLRGAPVDKPRPRWVVLVLAVMVAFETFVERGDSYPLYMAVAVDTMCTIPTTCYACQHTPSICT